jgi:hypothetical protein
MADRDLATFTMLKSEIRNPKHETNSVVPNPAARKQWFVVEFARIPFTSKESREFWRIPLRLPQPNLELLKFEKQQPNVRNDQNAAQAGSEGVLKRRRLMYSNSGPLDLFRISDFDIRILMAVVARSRTVIE